MRRGILPLVLIVGACFREPTDSDATTDDSSTTDLTGATSSANSTAPSPSTTSGVGSAGATGGEESTGAPTSSSSASSSSSSSSSAPASSSSASSSSGTAAPEWCELCCEPHPNANGLCEDVNPEVAACVCNYVDGQTSYSSCCDGFSWGTGCLDVALTRCGLACTGC